METIDNLCKNADISNLKTKSLEELIEIYQGDDVGSQECLISEVKQLFSLYKKTNNCKLIKLIMHYGKLKKCIEDYNAAIDCFLNFNHVFFILYTNSKNEYEKGKAFSLIGSSQVHLTKLQSNNNQLVYKKQQIEYIFALAISIVSFFAGIITSINSK